MSYSAVKSLVETHIGTISSLPQVATENTQIIVEEGTPFSRVTVVPAKSKMATVGIHGTDEVPGFVQVDLFYSLDDGTTEALATADAVISAFPRGFTLTDGSVVIHFGSPWCEVGRRVDGFYQVPITIPFTFRR